VAHAFGVKPRIEYLPARIEVRHAHADHAKARLVFGETEPIALEQGIARMAAWAKRAGARQSSVFENIEVERNLPASWQR